MACLATRVSPSYYGNALAVVALAVGVALLVLAWWAGLGGRLGYTLAAGQPKQALSFAVSLGVLLVLAPGNLALWANKHLDRSPTVVVSAPR